MLLLFFFFFFKTDVFFRGVFLETVIVDQALLFFRKWKEAVVEVGAEVGATVRLNKPQSFIILLDRDV